MEGVSEVTWDARLQPNRLLDSLNISLSLTKLRDRMIHSNLHARMMLTFRLPSWWQVRQPGNASKDPAELRSISVSKDTNV